MKTRTVHLKYVDTFLLKPISPFNFRFTLWKPSHFTTDLEAHTPMISWRTFRFGENTCGIRISEAGSNLEVQAFCSGEWNENLKERLINRLVISYGISEDISSFLMTCDNISPLRQPLIHMRGMRISCPESLFEISIVSLLLQNTTITRTTQMMYHMLEEYGHFASFDNCTLRVFFSPEDILSVSETEFRSQCRLGYRAKYLVEFAKFFADVDDDALRNATKEDLIAQVQTIKGVGPYTAAIIASHALRDPSAIALDVWNKKILAKALFDKPDAEASDIMAVCKDLFGDFAGLAVLYIIEDSFRSNPVCSLFVNEAAVHEYGRSLRTT